MSYNGPAPKGEPPSGPPAPPPKKYPPCDLREYMDSERARKAYYDVPPRTFPHGIPSPGRYQAVEEYRPASHPRTDFLFAVLLVLLALFVAALLTVIGLPLK